MKLGSCSPQNWHVFSSKASSSTSCSPPIPTARGSSWAPTAAPTAGTAARCARVGAGSPSLEVERRDEMVTGLRVEVNEATSSR